MNSEAVALEGGRVRTRERRLPALSGAWLLSGAMVGSGILTYVFHVLAARSLGADAYGQIAVLWAAVFLAAVVLFRPLEQTSARTIADRRARGEEIGTVLRSVGLICVAIVAVAIVAMAAGWSAVSDRLFLGSDTMTSLLVVGIAVYGVAYLTRGLLGGIRWFNGYGIGLLADAAARLLLALPLLFVASKDLAAVAVVAAGLAGALFPLYVGRRLFRGLSSAAGEGTGFRTGSALAFAAPASIIAAADQLLINGGPLLVMAEGGAAASKTAGVVFAATMLVRAPVYVFQGLAASLLPNLTHLQATNGARFRRAVLLTAGFLLAAGAMIVAFAAFAGPQAMQVLYGADFEAGRSELVLLGAGVAAYLAAATFSQALLAVDEGRWAAVAWGASAALFVGLYLGIPGDELRRISLAFAAATLAGLLLLASTLLRRTA